MKAMLWRIVFVVLVFLIIAWIGPLFLAFIGFSVPAVAVALLRACLVCIAVLYVIWGPTPRMPW